MEYKFTYGGSNGFGVYDIDVKPTISDASNGYGASLDACNGAGAGWFPLHEASISDDTFEIGDVVNLIVGGPDMVVISVCECGTVEVAWVDSAGDVAIDVFPEEALV